MHLTFRTAVSLLLLLVTVPLCAAADGCRLSLPEATVTVGDQVVMVMTATGASGVGAIDLALRFDPSVVRFSDIEAGPMLQGALIEANEIEPGRLLIALVSSEPLGPEGELFRIGLETVGAPDTRTTLSFEAANAYHLERLIDLPVRTSDGAVALTAASFSTRYLLIGIAFAVALTVSAILLRQR